MHSSKGGHKSYKNPLSHYIYKGPITLKVSQAYLRHLDSVNWLKCSNITFYKIEDFCSFQVHYFGEKKSTCVSSLSFVFSAYQPFSLLSLLLQVHYYTCDTKPNHLAYFQSPHIKLTNAVIVLHLLYV